MSTYLNTRELAFSVFNGQPRRQCETHSTDQWRLSLCQTFFDDVQVPKNDLVHRENQGWTVAKRLLQHERSGLAALANADAAGPLERIKPEADWGTLMRHYLSDYEAEPL